MRATVIVTMVLTAASIAGATAYVDEDFTGSFPPPRWTTQNSGGSAGWDRQSGGPSGNYALGWAFSMDNVERWAQLVTYAFRVEANTTVEFRFDYRYFYGGITAPNYAEFALFYAETPTELIGSRRVGLATSWAEYAAEIKAPRAGSIKARFKVWVRNPSTHSSIYEWDVDNVLINDKTVHAVSPVSIGRVKALYR
jgi:hypothetical protein